MRPVYLFFVLFLGLIVQTTVFVQKPFNWFQPVLPVLLTVMIAYYRGPVLAMLLGVLVGLIQDVVYGNFVGMHAFSLGAAGYFSGLVFGAFLHRSLLMLIFVILGSTAAYEFANYGISAIFGAIRVEAMAVMTNTIRLMIFNGVFALLLYPLADKWFPVKEERGMGDDYL